MLRFVKYIAFVLSVLVVLVSCEADKVNTSPDIKLSFSADTISFDTIFTAKGSTTKKLKIYNRCKNKVVVSSILVNGNQYELNLDGRKGRNFQNVTINANDSMVAYVQVYIDPNDDKQPFLVEGSLDFMTNGNAQQVHLSAYGRNAKRFRNHTFNSDTVITSYLPILVFDTLVVAEGKTLTVTDGATLYFHDKALLKVDGTLVMSGALGKEVTMRGDRSDFMNTNPPLNYDNASSQWGGIWLTSTSRNNELNYANVRNATFGIVLDSLQTAEKALLIKNSKVFNSSGNLIWTKGTKADISIENSLIYDAGGYLLSVNGGNINVTHCTFSNSYSYTWGSRTCPSVMISSVLDSVSVPVNANFYNTIIYGGYTDEIVFSRKEGEEAQCVYQFKNCLVKESAGKVDDKFIDCKINESPLFVHEGWSEDVKSANPHKYDFHLQDGSPAIGAADPQISKSFPVDLDGVNRLSREVTDIGCYTK
ncbi:MAG: hypothetical protein MJ003_02870 [Paludibacteraceae bacterium]|nr:hypothetical protein [Paludibacteraceae bacterium]